MPEGFTQFKSVSLEYSLVDKLIKYPKTTLETFYSGNGGTDKNSRGYSNRKYFDDEFNVAWDMDVLTVQDYVRVKLFLEYNEDEKLVYDK